MRYRFGGIMSVMAAVSITEALALEDGALAKGWTREQLLDAAGESLGHSIGRFFPSPGTMVAYIGKGHNAGDALVALRILRDIHGWKIAARSAYPPKDLAELTLKKWEELDLPLQLERVPEIHLMKHPVVLLDGLLGTGTSGNLRPPLLDFASEIATLRETHGTRIAAIDLPSGIDPDTGQVFPDTVVADVTFMIGNAKSGLLNAHAAHATGALAIVPVAPLTSRSPGKRVLISPQSIAAGKSPRPFDFHKGLAGRVAIVAGAEAYTGAAVLAASGALRGGAGLVTLHVPVSIQAVVSAKCPPEVIVAGFGNFREILDTRFDALVVGCGLGSMEDRDAGQLLELISLARTPAVIDADALNLIASRNRSDLFAENHILTPHPGEFARLAPDLAELPREEAILRYSERVPSTILLKGSRTLVTRKGEPLLFNSTGTPGMATGGQGDLLAGVIGARLAGGDSTMDAAAIGAWLCGRSAEHAMQEPDISEESLLPTDVLRHLGAASKDWKSSAR
jgi:hydroxyethylthiazole kinase-like uncharacterized protein yjeF